MSRDRPLSRRAALRLAAWGGAGLVAGACFPFCDDGGKHIAAGPVSVRLPAQATLSGKHGAWWIGDYQGLASTAGRIHAFWNDPRSGRLEIFTTSLH